MTCSGTIHVTFTWQPSFAGEVPPSVVVITKYAIASYSGTSGSVSNGLGDAAAPNGQYGKISAGTHYELKEDPGEEIEFDITPSATGSLPTPVFGAPPAAAANVMVDCSVTPVTIQSTFAIRDSGALCFLLGQEADFFVSGSGLTFTNHLWYPGHTSLDGVDFGAQHESNSFPGEYYYSTRATRAQIYDLTSSHPSWYYEGEQKLRESVKCRVTIKVGSIDLGSAIVEEALSIYVPAVSDERVIRGPSTIFDPVVTSTSDSELAEAGSEDPASTGQNGSGRGMTIFARVSIPPLFKIAQGEGRWTFVQLCSDAISRDYEAPIIDLWGLDNTYPYGGLFRISSEPYTPFDWLSTELVLSGGSLQPLLGQFNDSPSMGIGGRTWFSREFLAECFMVLRPPRSSGQSFVELPFRSVRWSYGANSVRSGLLWMLTSQYRAFPLTPPGGQTTTAYETVPFGIGITNEAMRSRILSLEMDWDHSNGNIP